MMSSTVVPPDCDGRISRILEYWRSIRPAEDRLPGRQHVMPDDLAELLPWLWLVDVQREPLRFRYRLIGTGHREVVGADLTGKWLDEAFANFPRMQGYADFLAVLQGEARYCRRAPEFPVDENYVSMERVLLPLARDGATVDMMLGLTVYGRADGRVD
ncbi:MAG TPA: PAS domain-containing protein [Stellaceae bacterium]|nr:PAS domain-containing protein [Stellaceae bacterium]